MKVAIFAKNFAQENLSFIEKIIETLRKENILISLYKPFAEECGLVNEIETFFNKQELLMPVAADYLFSIGGDGTFLDAANLVADANIPIVGINTGRIGFLTSINRSNFDAHFRFLKEKKYEIEERNLLHLEADTELPSRFALNDITIHPPLDSSLNSITVWQNDTKINTYWGDGLIIATPTGSTAYSLSCGGPIVMPSSDVIIITPIASHSLAVRPIVLSANVTLQIQVENRANAFSLSLDSHKTLVPNHTLLTITKEKFTVKTVRFTSSDFFSVISEKLLWGMDKRN